MVHVSDMIEVRNDSRPPRTKSGARAVEVYLPAHAKLESVLAAHSAAAPRTGSSDASSSGGAGGGVEAGSNGSTGRAAEQTATLISAAPIPDAPGHYAVSFPLRPGATKFAFNYDLPYDGHASFRPKNIYPLPTAGGDDSSEHEVYVSRLPAFIVLPTGNDRYQVEAASMVKAGAAPQFEISGLGSLAAQAQSTAKAPVATQSVPALSSPVVAQSQTRDANDLKDLNKAANSRLVARSSQMQSREEWWAVSGSAVILGT